MKTILTQSLGKEYADTTLHDTSTEGLTGGWLLMRRHVVPAERADSTHASMVEFANELALGGAV